MTAVPPRLTFAFALFAGLVLLVGAATARADAPGACPSGTPFTTGLTLAVDGQPQTASGPNVFGPYAVSLCRTSISGGSTNTYNFAVSRTSPTGDTTDLTDADKELTFTLAFTPEAGDTPLTAEGKARISSFAVDPLAANAVTLAARPIGFADIFNCQEPPLQCVISHPTADVFRAVNLSGSVRYGGPAGEGAQGFTDLLGMTTSSGAYVFFVWASCPTNPARDQSYSGLKIELGGPHLLPDGTVNVGSVSAFLPAAAVASCFGASPQAYAASAAISRTENGATAPVTTTGDGGLQLVLTADDTGVTMAIPAVTFSQPTYRFGTKNGKSLARTTRTLKALARAAHLRAPRGGSVRVVVSRASRKVCAAGVSSVYGFRRGRCTYAVQTISAKGGVLKQRKGSFPVS